jgi:hypothetical protein
LARERQIGGQGWQREDHQRKVTRVSRPSTWGMLDVSSIMIST